jgi:hypothetical protein
VLDRQPLRELVVGEIREVAGHVDDGMWFQDADGADFQVLVHDTVAASVTFDSWTGGSTYNLTGILGFGVNLSSNSAPLLQIRGPDDRVPM